MKRPIVVFSIGYIIGIIWGLYCNISIVFLYLCIFLIEYIKRKILKKTKRKFKLISFSRYSRYIKIFLKSNVIILIIISSIISNSLIIYLNNKYREVYSKLSGDIEGTAIVVSNKIEKTYKNIYKVKLKQVKIEEDTKIINLEKKEVFIYININIDNNYNLKYGDTIYFKGNFSKPTEGRNYKGFNYAQYLKQEKIYGTLKVEKINILKNNSYNVILENSNKVFLKIKQNIEDKFNKDTKDLLLGIILGYTENLDENIKQNFNDSNLSHVLAISGMHITIIISSLMMIFKKIFGRKFTKIFICLFLISYMLITGFSSSIIRAGIMSILMLLSTIFYRKNDIWTSISLSLLILMFYNPFLVENIGLQLSYAGTIGIIVLNKTIYSIITFSKKNIKILTYVNSIISVSISAQIFIIPIMILNFNTVNFSFIFTSIIISVITGPIIMLGFLFILFSFTNDFISSIIHKLLELLLKVLLLTSNLGAKLPMSKIYVSTPSLPFVLIYYVCILVLIQIYKIYKAKNINTTQKRVKNLMALFKYKYRKNKKRAVSIILILCLIINVIKIIPKELKIYFIDVGQGDSTLIITPQNKKILIDGGGSLIGEYDVGKNILLPYLLDRGITKLDYIFISHFDSDHVRTDCLQ